MVYTKPSSAIQTLESTPHTLVSASVSPLYAADRDQVLATHRTALDGAPMALHARREQNRRSNILMGIFELRWMLRQG